MANGASWEAAGFPAAPRLLRACWSCPLVKVEASQRVLEVASQELYWRVLWALSCCNDPMQGAAWLCGDMSGCPGGGCDHLVAGSHSVVAGGSWWAMFPGLLYLLMKQSPMPKLLDGEKDSHC